MDNIIDYFFSFEEWADRLDALLLSLTIMTTLSNTSQNHLDSNWSEFHVQKLSP